MNDLHQHITRVLLEPLKSRRIVTWYDTRGEFSSYVAELCGGQLPASGQVDVVEIADTKTRVCVVYDSFFEVKFAVEAFVMSERPDPLVIYIPNKQRDDQTAILMELEAGGERWEPQLKREARRVLKKRYSDGQIDQMLESDNVSYQDIVGLLGTEAPTTSMLDVIFREAKGDNPAIIAAWLANPDRDKQLLDKGVTVELFQLISSRLGLVVPEGVTIDEARGKILRYVLVAEFRSDLDGDVPLSIQMIDFPSTKGHIEQTIAVAVALRKHYPDAYVELADTVEREMKLSTQSIDASRLGKIDTFRFEESSLLDHAGKLILSDKFDDAVSVIENRRKSFWATHFFARQEQWQAYDLAANLAKTLASVGKSLPDSKKPASTWVEGYTAKNGWYRADLLHRRLESALTGMSDPIESETVIHRVRQEYEKLLEKMTRGFTSAFSDSGWSIPGTPHQTDVYSQHVRSPSEVVCYLLVDALRFEMGVELMGLLDGAESINLQPAIGAIPTITPIGMAALMPGADEAFSVVEHKSNLAVQISGNVAANLSDRRKIWKGLVPDVLDIELEKVLSQSPAQLQKKIEGAPLIVVRSVEIDAMGEGGNTFLARQIVDTAIGNVARAIKRLASAGVAKFVVASDHGHLFAHERDESQRIENPGGDGVALHRRCWAGRGGANSPATIRVSGSQLGYATDMDFVFPRNNSVFKAGGDLSYYHGGISLQELIIPILTVRMSKEQAKVVDQITVTLTKVPEKVATRLVVCSVTVAGGLFLPEYVEIRPVLLSDGQQVGEVKVAIDGDLVTGTQRVRVRPDKVCNIGFQLVREDVKEVEIVILDPTTDQVLAKSSKILVKLGL
ncbi:MAG: PglZ domain-containing protein [Pirellulaceae bacterium]|nr:PglZ domain-containing protein [Pirellulaceae bacterium]